MSQGANIEMMIQGPDDELGGGRRRPIVLGDPQSDKGSKDA